MKTQISFQKMCHNTGKLDQCTLYDRVKKLLVSYEWSDCTFSVSDKYFKAHKLILGISSPVFEAMFYGPLSTDNDIVITDIEPDIFKLLITYIYTDKVNICSIEQAFELLYASKKYMLEYLSEMCISYIKENMSVENVMTVLSYPDYLQDQQLHLHAVQLFCEHGDYLLQEHRKAISHLCLRAILESDQMNMPEGTLINLVLVWTVDYCEVNNIPPTFENRRNILIKFGLLKLLRFMTLSLDEFIEVISNINNVLIPIEIENIINGIKNPITGDQNVVLDSLGSTLSKRSNTNLKWCLCHRTPVRPVAPLVISCINNTVHTRVKADKTVFVKSLCIPTRMAPVLNFPNEIPVMYPEKFLLSIVSESGDENQIKEIYYSNTVEYNSLSDLDLDKPYVLKRNEWYNISFKWTPMPSQHYTYVVEYRDSFCSDQRLGFEFDDSACTLTSGCFLVGLKFCL